MALMSHLTLPPSRIREKILHCLKAELVPHVTSSPGMGKSDIMRSIAEEYGLELIDMRLSQCDITDLNGLPRFTADGRAEYASFTNFPLEGDPLPKGKNGWLLFFDELSSADKQMQAAAYKVILDRMIGQRMLHPKVLLACAGNLESDNAVVHGMSTALQSRLVHLEMRLDHEEWMTWAIAHKVDHRILGFLEFKPDYLHKFDPDHTDRTFACPRTWWFADKLFNGRPITNDDTPLLAGTISSGVAQEFVQFAQIYADLPKMSEIEADPENAPVPTEPSTRYAMASVVADHFSASNAVALAKYVARYGVEFRVIMLRMIHARQPSLVKHKALASIQRDLVARAQGLTA